MQEIEALTDAEIAEAIAVGKRGDSYAEETDRYRNLTGALVCLIED